MGQLRERQYIDELYKAAVVVVPVDELPVHTIEQVARSIIHSAVSSPHYDDSLLDVLGPVRTATFREPGEQNPLAEELDTIRFRYTDQLRQLMSDEEISILINDLDKAKGRSAHVYNLCRTIRFLHDAGCELLHWI